MRLSFDSGADHLVCQMESGSEQTTVTASNSRQALADMLSALDDLQREGCGECYWREACGDYFWLFRREGSDVRIVLLWGTGTLTGWEHKFYAQCPLAEFDFMVRTEIARHEALAAL